jgi:hypothetical protein
MSATTPLPLPRTLAGKIVLGVAVVAAAGAFWAGVWGVWVLTGPHPALRAWAPSGWFASPAPAPRVLRTLDVNVGWNATVVRVTNNGPDGVGQPLEIYLNGQPPFAFRADTTVPPQGLFVVVPLRQFVNRDGDRFNPVTQGVTVAWVGGGSYDFQSYGR